MVSRFFLKRIPAYPLRAPKTKRMHVIIQAERKFYIKADMHLILEIAVSPSTFGEFEVTLLKILIKTRKMVTRRVIRPGTISGGIKKLT